jgi:hypothetical protein
MRIGTLGAHVLFVVAAMGASGAHAESEAERIRSHMSRDFCGSFQWQGDPTVQNVAVSLGGFRIDEEGRVVAEGKGRYTTDGQITDIDVKWLIDPRTKRFEMWELNPSQLGFTTDGSHVGSLDDDLRSLSAVWTTSGSEAQGTLSLSVCSNATSALTPPTVAFAALPHSR